MAPNPRRSGRGAKTNRRARGATGSARPRQHLLAAAAARVTIRTGLGSFADYPQQGALMPRHGSLRSLVLLLVLAGCAGPGTAPEASADPTALRDAIQAPEREWSAAFLASNAAGGAPLYTEEG